MMTKQQTKDNLEHLQAHVLAVHCGLLALLVLLHGLPGEHHVRASSVKELLQPLASEAEQAEMVARLLLDLGSLA